MNVLLLDDHPLMLEALAAVVRALAVFDTVETAPTGRQALARLQCPGADIGLLLLDLDLGPEDGFEVLIQVRQLRPELPVLIVSANENPRQVARAEALGAAGYLPKRAPVTQLRAAVLRVLPKPVRLPVRPAGAGGAGLLIDGQPLAGLDMPPVMAPEHFHKLCESLQLTARQSAVLGLILEGLSNKEIARRLDLSIETVKDHVTGLLRVLGVSTRTQAVLAIANRRQSL